jgi:two-component system, cell cycle response regulator DivK
MPLKVAVDRWNNMRSQNQLEAAVSSYASSGSEGKARQAGCEGYIAKPFSPRQTLARIRHFIG